MSANVGLDESAENRKRAAPAAPVPISPQPMVPVRAEDTAGTSRAARTAITRPRWETRYAQAVAASDLVAMAVSLGLRQWWGQPPAVAHLPLVLGPSLLGLTATTLGLTRAWDSSILGQGSEEFSRLLRALGTVAVVLGLVGLALKLPEVRPWVFVVIPVACGLATGGRLVLRKVLHRCRRHGGCTHEVLAVGTVESVAELIVRTRRASHHGWKVTAACTPSGTGTAGGSVILDVPVVGDLDSVAEVAGRGRHRVVSVAQAPGWTSRRLHHLAWDLEGTGAELVVDPGLMEIAGPRLHVAAVDGQPLLRLTEPAFTGIPRVIKAAGDRLAGGLLLVLLAPVMVAIAIAVRIDGGPVFHRQARIGKDGTRFSVLTFRSAAAGGAEGLTRVGALLHKYSLDELPQLLNVLGGSMSLVGPRPPLPEEVAGYSRDAQRKLLVKPGLTGLWQISCRRDLSWEESVRLDLRYVENWTLALDALIVWKTVGAVLRGTGAD
ncbi:MAG TPA: sugar transferase [Pseudonocardiaceae bacterium]|nr:sugar transferase [Pseudonocardiaceae bacterium]